ncbi:MAG: hypothetical protein JF628_11635 [Sphingomonas sp.]|nr:hypothetical protein [Sphingomonas sp.]
MSVSCPQAGANPAPLRAETAIATDEPLAVSCSQVGFLRDNMNFDFRIHRLADAAQGGPAYLSRRIRNCLIGQQNGDGSGHIALLNFTLLDGSAFL